MPSKMLIDSSHPEETRVVVVHGNRIEEFDFESQDKKQLKGNIYLARVTRVEPSLQAAFIEYGGNRHGFLAFSEIHPDYYQIPVADRQALLRAEAEAAEDDHDDDHDGDDRGRGRRRRRAGRNRDRQGNDDAVDAASSEEQRADAEASEQAFASDPQPSSEAMHLDDAPSAPAEGVEFAQADLDRIVRESVEEAVPSDRESEPLGDLAPAEEAEDAPLRESDDEGESPRKPDTIAAAVEVDVISESVTIEASGDERPAIVQDEDGPATRDHVAEAPLEDHEIESVGAEDALEEVRSRRKPIRRQYKIQEVIKRRQILLVQVVKEERGNKGAALTTYLSLAGRYSVLMPNTARGGGISRKITNAQDRKRLKEVVQDLDVPQGMGVILRTAGESRTKAEIKRDYEYLMRLWETVRTLTLESTAPALVYEEGSLIKRSVRDLYNKDIDEVIVSGDNGYREAKDFMRMLMPSHAKVVQPYRDPSPIFARFGIEQQLDRMLQPQVTLKSGGYIIINQTEALVAIDVNSGRSTREHSIEETALHTNLEAAEEVARQLRLRDMAGLVVIDFIDMEENRNNRSVEKRLKDCLKNDRARIQLGRISHFGLLEMSRQRIRASVLESTMKPCPHCGGTGHVRSDSSVALLVVRAIEEFLIKDSRTHIMVRTPSSTAMYVLNHKRGMLNDLEQRFGLVVTIEADETVGAQHYLILRGATVERPAGMPLPISAPAIVPDDVDEDIISEDEEVGDAVEADNAPDEANGSQEGDHRRRKRRRRRRGGRDREQTTQPFSDSDTVEAEPAEAEDDLAESENEPGGVEAGVAQAEAFSEGDRRKRRRGKRGGRRNRADEDQSLPEAVTGGLPLADANAPELVNAEPEIALRDETGPSETVAEAVAVEAEQKKPRRTRAKRGGSEAEATPVETTAPKRAPRRKAGSASAVPQESAPMESSEVEAASDSPATTEPLPITPETSPALFAPVTVEVADSQADEPSTEPAVVEKAVEPEPERPKKSGWWKRKGFF